MFDRQDKTSSPASQAEVEDKLASWRQTSSTGWSGNKKMWLIVGALVVAAGVVTALSTALSHQGKSTPPTPVQPSKATPSPVTQPALLDGVAVAANLAIRHPLAIMIENSPDARPQTGLTDASVIYEAIVEGGITRFMALYGPTLPEKVGPVRSARQVYVDLIKEYTPVSAYYAHVGGAPDALVALKNDKLYDLDQFGVGEAAFHRLAKTGVASEHTMFAFPVKLYNVAADRGYKTESTFRPWRFKDDALVDARPAAQTITVPFSGAAYDVAYTYDRLTNSYTRSVAGTRSTDAATGKALAPKNIVVQLASYATRKGDNKGRQNVDVSSGGSAKVFRDGIVIAARWAKDKASNRTVFSEAATGEEIKLNRGQTIVEITKADAQVTVTEPSPTASP